jgi:hypothetical protein
MEKYKVMKVIIQWSPEEDCETRILDKLWNFTTDNFSGEIPCVDDKMLLNLPSENSLKGYEPWKFQVIQRTWEPENSTIHLKVRLDNPQEFLDLSEEEKAYLADKLRREGSDRGRRRTPLSFETVHVNTTKEQEIPEPRRPKPNLQTVHISQTSEEQEIPDLESSTSKSYQEEKSHQESEAKTQVRDLEITDTIVHSRNKRQFDVYGTTFTQIHQQGC